MKNFLKIRALLCTVLAFSFTACSDGDGNSSSSSQTGVVKESYTLSDLVGTWKSEVYFGYQDTLVVNTNGSWTSSIDKTSGTATVDGKNIDFHPNSKNYRPRRWRNTLY